MFQKVRQIFSAEVKYFAYVRYATSPTLATIPRSTMHFVPLNHLRYDQCSLCILTIWRPGFDPTPVHVALCWTLRHIDGVFSLSLSFYTIPLSRYPHCPCDTLTSNVCVCVYMCVCAWVYIYIYVANFSLMLPVVYLIHKIKKQQFLGKSELLALRHKVTMQTTQVFTEILLYNRLRQPTTAFQ
jgi:hypothetical protein